MTDPITTPAQMREAAALLPCPFCGGEASAEGYQKWSKPAPDTTWDNGDPITEAYFCNCPTCAISNITSGIGYRTRAEAIAAWNRRATPTVQEAAKADSFDTLISEARSEAAKAMQKFPQPNYVISKVAEEAGEVVKAAIHCAEGRETAENVRSEMKQLIAMLYRLWVEGDQVHGLRAIAGESHE